MTSALGSTVVSTGISCNLDESTLSMDAGDILFNQSDADFSQLSSPSMSEQLDDSVSVSSKDSINVSGDIDSSTCAPVPMDVTDTDTRSDVDDRTSWTGFTLVGDNVDKNIHRSFQRIGYNTQSLHLFNTYAVLDRVDLSTRSDTVATTVVDPASILPTSEDYQVIEQEFQVLVKRYVSLIMN